MLNKPEFYEKLKTLLNSGISLRKALEIIVSREKGASRRVLEAAKNSVDSGESLAGSLRGSGMFSPLEISLVRSGEITGNLEKNLDFLIAHLLKSKEWKRKIATGLIYPFILFHAAVLLPPLSLLVMQGPAPYLRAVARPFAALYLCLLLFAASVKLIRKSGSLSLLFEKILWSVPIYSGIRRGLALSRFLKSMGLALKAGLGADRALELSADSSGNRVVQNSLHGVRNGVLEEKGVTGVLEQSGLLPGRLLSMVHAGEESGSVDDALIYAADDLEKGASTLMDRLAVILPVVIYLGVALYIAGIIIRFYAGLYCGLL